jgi:hypothetical protein
MRLDVGQQRVLEAFNELSDVPRPRQAGELSVQVRDLMAGQTGGTRLDDKRAAVDQAHNREGPGSPAAPDARGCAGRDRVSSVAAGRVLLPHVSDLPVDTASAAGAGGEAPRTLANLATGKGGA